MIDEIHDGVLINLLHKGPTAGALLDVARPFMGKESLSARYKQSLRDFSIGEPLEDDTHFPIGDQHRSLFYWHYRPRVYQVFGFFDLAVLQLCDSVEIISELSAQPNVSATQNIFGLRTRTSADGRGPHGTLELCSPLLPYLFICNVKVHPFVQMLLGKDLHALLNLHLSRYLDEIEVLQRAVRSSSREDLLTIAVIDTFGWNELTFLIHGSAFDRMSEFVWNQIRDLRLAALPLSSSALSARIETLRACLQPYGLPLATLEQDLQTLPLFSHTESVPCIDFFVSRRLRAASLFSQDTSGEALGNLLATIREGLQTRINGNSVQGRYLGRATAVDIQPALDRIVADMSADRAGCLSGFSIQPGRDAEFHSRFAEVLGRQGKPEVVLGQYEAFFKQFHEQDSRGLMERLQRIIKMRSLFDEEPKSTGKNRPLRENERFPTFDDLVASSKTAICSPIDLQQGAVPPDPFEELRTRLKRFFKFEPATSGRVPITLLESCRQIQMPQPLQISLEHTLEPFYSFLQNPSLFSQYIDLYLPLLLIAREIQRAAAGREEAQFPIAEHVSRELRQFNHAFQALFQASHLNSESTESTLEFKAHTVTPLDMIHCIIDCFTQVFVGFDKIAGFSVISVSNRPVVHISDVFSVELNSLHLLYPESLPALFHELGHLYLRYRDLPRSDRELEGEKSFVHRMFNVKDEQSIRRWQAFTALIPAQEPGQSVNYEDVEYQVEDILSDLFVLTTVCRNDWDLFLWYVLVQFESFPEYFPDDARPDDPEQIAFFREVLTRLFLAHSFWTLAGSDQPQRWVDEFTLDRFQEFSSGLRQRSKKIRDFCAKSDVESLEITAWGLAESLVQPARSFAMNPQGLLYFQENEDFWRDDSGVLFTHPGLSAMVMSLIFANYRWMLEHIVANWILSCDDAELGEITDSLEIDFDRLQTGKCSLAELSRLFAQFVAREVMDPAAYLEELRTAPSTGLGRPVVLSGDDPWPLAYRRVTRALYALVKFFQEENTAGPEDFRYLYRDPKTGKPEQFKEGRSDVEASPLSSGEGKPLAIVIDRRGVLFCRSTAARQRAFQYRNAVIRELADLHSKLRPRKMAEIARITDAYRSELPTTSTPDAG